MNKSEYQILLVEDEKHMVETIKLLLRGQYALRDARTLQQARAMLKEELPDLLLLDLNLPDGSGEKLLEEIKNQGHELDVIVITASKDVQTAVNVMKMGARDYISKPFDKEDLLLSVEQAFERWQLQVEVNRLRSELYEPFGFDKIVGDSAVMKRVIDIARKMTQSEATVLLTGESGTGKELIARAIHCEGTRRKGPFVPVNCAQFDGPLLDSTLFGHEKGAFTGAISQHKGCFEQAEGGTLFLDEIGETPPETQAKILRAVETREFQRLGGTKPLRVNVRLIAATNANLKEKVETGEFREDLYYRISVVPIHVPPLRERKKDIPDLCNHFLKKVCAKTGRRFLGIAPNTMEVLMAYDWPGNIRELEHLIEMLVALEEGEWITMRYVPGHILAGAAETWSTQEHENNNLLQVVVEDFERRFIEEQLRIHKWNHRKTAKALGVHRNTIENKIKKYKIEKARPRPIRSSTSTPDRGFRGYALRRTT